jgi:putative ABC transport system substrate-binding protein
MRRREFIALAAGGVAVQALPVGAQQTAMPVIGCLSGTSFFPPFVAAFRDGLNETGLFDGQNVVIEYRWAEGVFDRLPALAGDLVQRKVAVIVASGGALSIQAAKNATDTIPTVFLAGDDPVATGLVASLAHPGANRTGISFMVVDLNTKRLELLLELVPRAGTVALIVNPGNSAVARRVVSEVEDAASGNGVQVNVVSATSPAEIDAAFTILAEQHAAALLIGNDAFFNSQRERFVSLASRHGIPAIYEESEAVRAGGLISYGASGSSMHHQLGVYAGKILKGARPGDLPVEQPTKFELVINTQTAKVLGLTVPPQLLARADEVIE